MTATEMQWAFSLLLCGIGFLILGEPVGLILVVPCSVVLVQGAIERGRLP